MEPEGRDQLDALLAQIVAETDDDERWRLIHDLWGRGRGSCADSVVARVGELIRSSDEREVLAGIDIAAQLCWDHEPRRNVLQDMVLSRCPDADQGPVALSLAGALHHIAEHRALPCLHRLGRSADPDVRALVAFATSRSLLDEEKPHGGHHVVDATSAEILLDLVVDEYDEVAEWSTFTVGELMWDWDSDAVRAALLENLDDANVETRRHALVGLALRGDTRVTSRVKRRLRADYSLHPNITEAAAGLAVVEPSLRRHVLRLRDEGAFRKPGVYTWRFPIRPDNQTLLALAASDDDVTREWATFTVGELMPRWDSPEVIEALEANLDDANADTRRSALIGLALRGDTRVTGRVVDALGSTPIHPDLAEAVRHLARVEPGVREHVLAARRRGSGTAQDRALLDDILADNPVSTG